jgi:acetylornithine deacetylase/succinyl-diaminopimelate desuccinylase-like protein
MKASNAVTGYTDANQSRFITELKHFIRLPSISAQPQHVDDLTQCADWLTSHLQRIGLKHIDSLRTRRHPIVYAESKRLPHRPTVLIYGHYDVQPPDPLDEWHSPPFQPVVRGANLYGRGACDDKGQMFAHIKAIEAYLCTQGSLPVNVKCLFEGGEEIGSPNLPKFLERNRHRLGADVAVISDMSIIAPGRPAITYALRGALSVEIEVTGPEQDLHSGTFGGAVHNPLQVLAELIAALHESNGRIAIPGFYNRVRLWSDDERNYMASVGPTDPKLLRDAKASSGWGEFDYTAYERTTIRPALTVNGIVGGYQGEGAKAVIPRRAVAKLNLRLVPDQTPREIDHLFRAHIARIAPPTVGVTVRTLVAAHPALINRNHPVMRAAAVAYRKGFGAEPVFLRSGGTIPVVNLLQQALDIPIVLMGFALPDDHIHGPNEKFHLPNFFNGIKTSIWFLSEVASRFGSQKTPPS